MLTCRTILWTAVVLTIAAWLVLLSLCIGEAQPVPIPVITNTTPPTWPPSTTQVPLTWQTTPASRCKVCPSATTPPPACTWLAGGTRNMTQHQVTWAVSAGTVTPHALCYVHPNGDWSPPAPLPVTVEAVPVADTEPPSAPVLAAYVETTLAWDASSDNVGVTQYIIQLEGVEVGRVPGGTLEFTHRHVRGSLAYTVQALDAAGNVSPVAALFPPAPQPVTCITATSGVTLPMIVTTTCQ